MDRRRDEELVTEVQGGNIAAFEELVKRFQRPLISFVYKILWDYASTEEVVQDAFFSVYTTIHRVDPNKKFSSYVFTLAKNAAISHLRKRKATVAFNEDIHAIEDDAKMYDYLYGLDTKKTVESALKSLEKKYQLVIDLYYFQDMSYDEIAKKLHIPINTVRTHLSRAKETLKKRIII